MGMIAAFRGRKDIDIGKRRVAYSLVHQALAVFVSCLIVVMTATLFICAAEPDTVAPFKEVLFETVSVMVIAAAVIIIRSGKKMRSDAEPPGQARRKKK